MVYLQNDTIRLRAVEPGDVTLLYRWENDTAQWNDGDTTVPFSRHNIAEYASVPHDLYADRQLRLMIELTDDNTTVGAVDLYDFDPRNKRAAVGITIDAARRRQQLATMAIELLKQYCSEFIGMHQLWCIVNADNAPSLSLFKKTGFRQCGYLRSWINCGRKYGNAIIFQLLFC